MLAVRSPGWLLIVTDSALEKVLVPSDVPLVHGVDGSAPLTVITPTSALMLVVHETVAFCMPEGGLATQKINVRMIEFVPESVPGINAPVTPPRLALILVAVVADMASMIIAARFMPLPTRNDGVVICVAFH